TPDSTYGSWYLLGNISASGLPSTISAQRFSTSAGNHNISVDSTLTVTGFFEDSGSITKLGPRTLIFGGDNTYTGSTTIASGALQVGDGGATGSLGNGPIQLGAGAQMEHILRFSRTVPTSLTNDITLDAPANPSLRTIDVQGNDVILNGQI